MTRSEVRVLPFNFSQDLRQSPPRVRPGELKGQQAQRHRQQACAGECDDLSGEQVAVGAVGKNVEHA
jgi:hypothetical protein